MFAIYLIMDKQVFLADDDADDRLLFEEAIQEVTDNVHLTSVENGEQLMHVLENSDEPVPEMIFLDINMPMKNGLECLTELKKDKKFQNIPVVIFSTSCQQETIDSVYDIGADYYICKPDSFQKLKKLLSKLFSLKLDHIYSRPSRQDFLITA